MHLSKAPSSLCLKKTNWLQVFAQGSPATTSGHLTFVAPGRQRTTNKPHRSKKRTLRPTTSKIKMTIAVIDRPPGGSPI